ncbi:MAG TPA: hypothetical protein VFE34_20345 [Dongiaceae bacterium]|nr:hypothetical protein [Dongiaceae bacterium]
MRAETSFHRSPDLPVTHRRLTNSFPRAGALLRRLYRSLTEAWLRRAMINELQRFNARDLRDFGIERYQIDTVVDNMLAKRRRDEGHP